MYKMFHVTGHPTVLFRIMYFVTVLCSEIKGFSLSVWLEKLRNIDILKDSQFIPIGMVIVCWKTRSPN